MLRIDIRDLRSAVLIGAIVGAVIGFGSSGTLRASSGSAEAAAASSACNRILCERSVWLRAPILRRSGSH